MAARVPRDAYIILQPEHGIVGMQSVPEQGLGDDDLSDPGRRHVSALPLTSTRRG